jgi:hypothetical protein
LPLVFHGAGPGIAAGGCIMPGVAGGVGPRPALAPGVFEAGGGVVLGFVPGPGEELAVPALPLVAAGALPAFGDPVGAPLPA